MGVSSGGGGRIGRSNSLASLASRNARLGLDSAGNKVKVGSSVVINGRYNNAVFSVSGVSKNKQFGDRVAFIPGVGDVPTDQLRIVSNGR